MSKKDRTLYQYYLYLLKYKFPKLKLYKGGYYE